LQRDEDPVGKLDRCKAVNELAPAQAWLRMLPQAQRAFDLRRFAADGVLVGLEGAADRIECDMPGLIAIEEKVHPRDDVDHRGSPDLWLSTPAIQRLSPAKPPPQFQRESRQFRIEVSLAELFHERGDFAEALALFF